MKQYRITTENILYDSPDDCIISPNDPFHQLKLSHHLGGLGTEVRLAEYRYNQLPKINQDSPEVLAAKKAAEPGTSEWFKLHFSRQS